MKTEDGFAPKPISTLSFLLLNSLNPSLLTLKIIHRKFINTKRHRTIRRNPQAINPNSFIESLHSFSFSDLTTSVTEVLVLCTEREARGAMIKYGERSE